MQWAYYWYYSALGCHDHLVRDIQFSLFHHHYLWGHLLWKMNSASFAWLISKFFFIYLTEGHMPGIWSWWKKKKSGGKKKGISRGWVGVRALEDVCGSKTDPSGLLAYPTAFVIPARATFSPLSFCTLKRVRAFSLQSSWSPLVFLLSVGGCILIYIFFFLIPWNMGYLFSVQWRKKQPFLSLCGMLLTPHPFKVVVSQGCFLTMLKCLAYV